jgi:methylenetetrahydrofolate--tRNA-(uracil-5-)-methyltransferase
MIPGLENAQFLRLGAVHRNTYLDSPALLDERMRLRSHPHVRFAGQITGVEGYVESAAHGLVTGLLVAGDLAGAPSPPPPPETALGTLTGHVLGGRRLEGRPHEPQNINWGMFPPAPVGTKKRDRKHARVERARAALSAWANEVGLTLQ